MGHQETNEVVIQIRSHEVCAGCSPYAHYQSITSNERTRREKGRVRGGCVDKEELTPSGHPKCLASPVHLRGCTVVVGNSVECHVFGIGHSGLELGHDMVDPLFEEGPSGGQVGIWRRHRIDGWVIRGHFVKSDNNLRQTEVVVRERKEESMSWF